MPRLLALACVLLALPARAQQVEDVLTRDGQHYVGTVRPHGAGIVVATRLVDCYLCPAEVVKRTPGVAAGEPPTYVVNQDRVSGPKKGTVGPVVKDMAWGAWQADGSVSVTLEDFKLGKLALTLVVTRITPASTRLDGVEYNKRLEYSTRALDGLLGPLLGPLIDRADAASLAKAVAFFTHYGELARARELLAALEALAPAHAGLAALALDLERATVSAALAEAERLFATDQVAEAHAALTGTSASFVLADAAPDLARTLDERKAVLAKGAELVRRVRAYLEGKNVTVRSLSAVQAEHVARLVGLDATGAAKLDVAPALLPLLLEPWARALATVDLEPSRLAAAGELALATALVFAERLPTAAAVNALVARYVHAAERARVPSRTVALAILAGARRYGPPEPGERWRKVEFDHPPRAKPIGRAPKFHYYVQLPTGYAPDRPHPVLVSLHGQMATAASQQGFWGTLADKHGYVLIAPEYIYGRPFGYRCSAEEHTAVLGAIQHAAVGLNLDLDRVFLQGASQGGHASWDIGGTQGARFAGILPVIGCPMTHDALPGFLGTSLYCVDGSDDYGAPANNRGAMEILSKLGARARYVEYRGRGHDGFVEEYEAMCGWMRQQRRAPAPSVVHHRALRSTDARTRWLEIDASRLGSAWEPGGLATATGTYDRATNRFTLETAGTAKLTLLIDPALVDLERTIALDVDGRELRLGRVAIDWGFAVADLLQHRDGEVYVARFVIPVTGRAR